MNFPRNRALQVNIPNTVCLMIRYVTNVQIRGIFRRTVPKKNEIERLNVPPNPKERAFHMILDRENVAARDQEYEAAYPKYKI